MFYQKAEKILHILYDTNHEKNSFKDIQLNKNHKNTS